MREQPTPSTDPAALGRTITDIDGLCQEMLGRITAVARLARLAGEHPGRSELDSIIHALGAIENMSDFLADHVNSFAEQVGCNCVEERHASA